MSTKRWYRLDNSAKIIPSMTNNLNTNVFRLTCSLKEQVDPKILNAALLDACSEFPMFLCTMKSGLFWHYLESSNIEPTVEEEHVSPCSKLDGNLLFRLTYYKKRINLEVYHVLADGRGAMEFLKYVVASYLDKVHNLEMHDSLNTASEFAKESDGFSKFDKASKKIIFSKDKRAYKLNFPRKEDTIHDVIEVHMSALKVRELAHKHETTVTIYLTALLILSIVKCAKVKDLKRPIGITVPIDLRSIFPSDTARNFFYTTCIQYKYEETHSLDDIIKILKVKFEKEFSKEKLQGLIDSYMILEKFLLIRIIPNVLKDFILSFIVGARRTETMTLSNLGIIQMPLEYDDYIESFSGFMSSNDIHLTTMSYNDDLCFGFTTHFVTNEIERNMIFLLKEEGVEEIKIVSNKER